MNSRETIVNIIYTNDIVDSRKMNLIGFNEENNTGS